MRRTRMVGLSLAFLFSASLVSCDKKDSPLSTGEIGVIQDTKFGSILMGIPLEDFNSLGFSFVDGIDISFTNGFKIENIPYYNGYYVPTGELVACGYPGYEHISITRAQGNSLWSESKVTADTKMTVTLHEKGEYLSVQNALNLSYSNKREDYSSDAEFANFRFLAEGKLKKDFVFRSASCCDDSRNRASFADSLAKANSIQYVFNLGDSKEELASNVLANGAAAPFYASLYEKGDVLAMDLGTDYTSESYTKEVADAFYSITDKKGPFLVHCLEGKDRTGVFCALLLALSKASLGEIKKDYMLTYKNYYGITEEATPERYEAVSSMYFGNLLLVLTGEIEESKVHEDALFAGAESYLEKGGLTKEQISAIETCLIS